MQGHSSGQHQVVVRSLLATMLREEWTVRAVRAPPSQAEVDSQPTGTEKARREASVMGSALGFDSE